MRLPGNPRYKGSNPFVSVQRKKVCIGRLQSEVPVCKINFELWPFLQKTPPESHLENRNKFYKNQLNRKSVLQRMHLVLQTHWFRRFPALQSRRSSYIWTQQTEITASFALSQGKLLSLRFSILCTRRRKLATLIYLLSSSGLRMISLALMLRIFRLSRVSLP